ncbi:MAG: hypothetical protein FWC73_14120 [Defluviitaleaceae bacterium]|nr:hypothetical protein [Defluviitaleaceae bacterium]
MLGCFVSTPKATAIDDGYESVLMTWRKPVIPVLMIGPKAIHPSNSGNVLPAASDN